MIPEIDWLGPVHVSGDVEVRDAQLVKVRDKVMAHMYCPNGFMYPVERWTSPLGGGGYTHTCGTDRVYGSKPSLRRLVHPAHREEPCATCMEWVGGEGADR